MNISPINFKGKIAYDDEISSKRRDYIRKHLDKDVFESSDVFIKNPRLEEYELNKLVKSAVKKSKIQKNKLSKIDETIMQKLPLFNVEPIYGTTSYRGGTIDLTDDICQKLKQAGVDEIVSFLECDFNKKVCEKNGLKYFSYPIGLSFWNSAPFKSRATAIREAVRSFYILGSGYEADKDKYINDNVKMWETNNRIFIGNFVDFINEMKKDNLYAGCACAINRTDEALTLNHFFNPDANKTMPSNYVVFHYYDAIENLYYNLTPKDKKKMGWTKEFDENFLKRLQASRKNFASF